MINNIVFLLLSFMYIYVTTFNIFMSDLFRLPAPIIFLTPLLIFYSYERLKFDYLPQLLIFFCSAFLYTLIGEQDITGFFAFLINLSCLVLFFTCIIGRSKERMMMTICIFFGLLSMSGIVMLIDHQSDMTAIRSLLAAGEILQSPSGISFTQFTFGYQMAALTGFIVPSIVLFKKNWLLKFVLISLALCFIFFGMQRSVLVAFAAVSVLFILLYYKAKSVLIIIIVIVAYIGAQGYMGQFSDDKNQQNILNKNVKQTNRNEDRGDLIIENFKVIADYPFGLIFYNKNWNDVVQHNHVYKNGHVIITSHNAYLMFITYLGPLIGLLLLILIYIKVIQIIWHSYMRIELKENAMLFCLSCSFIAVSINSFFHNEWLLTGSGPTLILYFSILHISQKNINNPLI